MSTIEKVGAQAGSTCVGAFALALGDPSGATLAATGILGLSTIVLARRLESVERARLAAKSNTIATLRGAPEFAEANWARVEDLLKIEAASLSRDDLVAASRASDPVGMMAELLYEQVAFDGDTGTEKRAVRLALEAGMRACSSDTGFRRDLNGLRLADVQSEVVKLRDSVATKDDVAGMEQRLLSAITASNADDPRRAMYEKREGLVIALAHKYAEGSPTDFDTALAGLTRALEVASARRPAGNLEDEIDAIKDQVDRLNDEGQIDAGVAELARKRAAMRAEQERHAAAYAGLLDRSIDQAILARDVADAAALSIEKLDREDGAQEARFEALRGVQGEWYRRGRDKGLRFDLEVAIAIAEEGLARAEGPVQRGAALIQLGIALRTLGERETGTHRLYTALAAFRAALVDGADDRRSRARVQINIGNALRTLGVREGGTERLKGAVAAYRAALDVVSRESMPLDWAMIQNNLGVALQTLGERDGGTDRLKEAVGAYRAALEKRERGHSEQEWATTKSNLGNALRVLGARERSADRVNEAITAFNDALEVFTPDTARLTWASTNRSLALAFEVLSDMSEAKSAQDHLGSAIHHVSVALEGFDREQTPLNFETATRHLERLHAKALE